MNKKNSKLITAFIAVLFAWASITAQETKTMYIMKGGKVDFQTVVSDLDSVIFYNPIPAVIPVTGISLDKNSHSLTAGANFTLVATVTPGNATDKSVTWSSSDIGVATVSSSGLVNAVTAGSANITVKSNAYPSITATCAVTVTTTGTTITKYVVGEGLNAPYTPLLTAPYSIAVGKQIAVGIPTTAGTTTGGPWEARADNFTWTSSDTNVATVNVYGQITGVGSGTTTITGVVTNGNETTPTSYPTGASLSFTLTVTGTPATDPFDKQITGPTVSYSDGGTAAMTNPFFWIRFAQDKSIDTDAVIMTASEISSFNTLSATTTLRITLPSTLGNETTVTHSQLTTLATTYGYTSKGSGFTTYVPSFTGSRNVQLGIVTSFAQMTTTPTSPTFGSSGNCETGLEVNEGVVIYASYGSYYLVKSQNYFGWVPQTTVATCSKSEFLDFATPSNFIVVTAERLPTSLGVPTMLRMGTKLPLVSQSGGNATFTVPTRTTAGTLSSQNVTLAADGNNEYIHVGYLPYTTKSLLKQMFKMLGQNYGWGDGNSDRDCSSTVGTAYRCLGFILPRNTTQMESIPAGTYCKSTNGNTNIMNVLSGYRPGTILLKSGHVVMYLGYYSGAHYIIHNSGDTRQSCKVTGLSIYNGTLTYLKSLQK